MSFMTPRRTASPESSAAEERPGATTKSVAASVASEERTMGMSFVLLAPQRTAPLRVPVCSRRNRADRREHRVETVGERGGAGLEDQRRLDLDDAPVRDGRDGVPTRTR